MKNEIKIEDLDREEERLNLWGESLASTVEFWNKQMEALGFRLEYLIKHESYENENELDELRGKVQFMINKGEWEKKEKLRFDKSITNFNKKKEAFVFRTYSNKIGSL